METPTKERCQERVMDDAWKHEMDNVGIGQLKDGYWFTT